MKRYEVWANTDLESWFEKSFNTLEEAMAYAKSMNDDIYNYIYYNVRY